MKRLLALLVTLGLVLVPARLAAQQPPIPVGLGGELSSLVGLPIEVPLVVDMSARPERLGSFALRLEWDPAVLRFEMGRYGSFGAVVANVDSASGVARITGVNPAGAAGRVTLGIFRLTPLTTGTTTLHLILGELFAAGTFADLKPFAVVSDGLYCPARGLWGDLDGDGNANSRDALIALSNAVGLDVSAFDVGLGDVDGSGTTNARDALIILSNAVGIDVSAFRVLRLAGGACAANAAVTLAIAPADVELVSGQDLLFEARASDGTGALQTITDVSWKSSNPAVLGVFADGRAVARAAGTAAVTVLRGTRDSAQTTVTVVARRTTHWVDILASDARVRLGTAALPFGSIHAALNFAQDGDTLRIRLGRYEIQNGTLTLNRPVVLIGDTAADGSRPTLVADSGQGGFSGDAIDISGPGRIEVQNLAFSGVTTGVSVNGTDCVLLRGVRMTTTSDGVYVGMPMHCLRIEHSVILGPDVPYYDAPVVGSPVQRAPGSPAYYGYSGGVTTDAPVDTLTIEDTEIAGFHYGVGLGTTPDSTTIRRSSLHDLTGGALADRGCHGECSASNGQSAARARAGHAPVARAPMDGVSGQPPAVVIEWSRLERSQGGYLVDLETPFRRVAFAHNVLSNPGGDVLYLYGVGGSGYVSMLGDSIVAPPDRQHYRWIDASYLDSLVIDSLQAVGLTYGSTYYVPLVRMTNSTLRNVSGNCDCTPTALEVSVGGSSTGGVLQLDNDSVIGDPRDDARADAFETDGARVEANRVTGVNLWKGIGAQCSDSSTTITNSLFRHVAYPISWCTDSEVAPDASVLTVRNTTFHGFSTAIESNDGRVVVDNNTFENGYQAIDLEGPRPITVTGNRISGTQKAIEVYSYDSTATVTIADNVLAGADSLGIYVEGDDTYPDTLQTFFDVRRNAVTCNAVAGFAQTGIELYDAHISATDNVVAGCSMGIFTEVSTNSVLRRDSIVGNTVTVPPNALVGIVVFGNVDARVGRNTVTGATTGTQDSGLVRVAGGPEYHCGQSESACGYIPLATIDSNTVTGGTSWGIRADGVDSLTIAGNIVRNLNTPTDADGYSEDFGGIAVFGYLSRFARVVGNVVRSIHGNGIVVNHSSGTSVMVDSNVVADIDSTAIFYANGPIAITRNLVTGARRDGIRLVGYGALILTGNNIEGNLAYGLRNLADRTDSIPDNWWGDPNGPRCETGCELSSEGDSVSTNIKFLPFRTAPNDSVPLLPAGAPRFLAQAAPAPAARPAGNGDPLDAPIPRMDRYARPPRAQAQRPAPSPGAATATGPAAERRAAQERERAAAAAHRAERLQQLRARAEARERTRHAAAFAPRRPAGQEVRP